MVRRSNEATVKSVDESWTVARAQYDGRPLIVRVNDACVQAGDLDQYPIRIGVALPLNDPDKDGWPSGPEGEQLQKAEDVIVGAARARAVLVAVITGTGMRELVFHARTSDWIGQFERDPSAAVTRTRSKSWRRPIPAGPCTASCCSRHNCLIGRRGAATRSTPTCVTGRASGTTTPTWRVRVAQPDGEALRSTAHLNRARRCRNTTRSPRGHGPHSRGSRSPGP